MKKLIKILICTIVILGAYETYKTLKKFQSHKQFIQLKKKSSKTPLDNIIFLEDKENKTLELVILNENKELIKFKGLNGFGNIVKNMPILLFKDKKFGYIDTNGKILRSINYEYLGEFQNGEAIIKNDKAGVINIKGKELIPLLYDEVYIGKNHKYILKKDNIFFLYDLKNFVKLDVDYIYQLNKELFIFTKNKKFGIMNIDNQIIIPNEFEEISMYVDKSFIGKKDSKFSIYDLKNNKVSDNFDYIEQIGLNEYRGGTYEIGKFSFISQMLNTTEKYNNINNINKSIFIGQINFDNFDIINLNTKEIINISKIELDKFLEELKRSNHNEMEK